MRRAKIHLTSLQGQKIELVKGTVDFLVEQLGDKDAMGLVTYSDNVSTFGADAALVSVQQHTCGVL